MRLVDGAEAIRGDLPAGATFTVEVPPEAGSDLGTGVHRLSSVQYVRDEVIAALHDVTGVPILVGGDCSADLGGISHATSRGDVAVVWIDAHPDLNTPETSPSGAFSGMVLRTLLGDGPAELVPAVPVRGSRVILAGMRAADDAESDYIDAQAIAMLAPGDLTPESLSVALRATGATSVYLHINLDVLDPAEFECVGFPEPFGLSVAALIEIIVAARTTLPSAGAAITGFSPATVDSASSDMPTILRIIGALTKQL